MVNTLECKQDKNNTKHTERLNSETGDTAAAEGDLYGLADVETFTSLVRCPNICVGCASHTKNTHDRTHACTDNKCDSARLVDEKREDYGEDQNNDHDALKLCLQECCCAFPDDTGKVFHVICTFIHLFNLRVVEEDVQDGNDDNGER